MSHEEYKRLLCEQHLAKVAERDRLSDDGGRTLKKDDPEYRREYMRRYRQEHPITDEERARRRAREKSRYRTDPEFRERKKAQSRKTRMKRAQEEPCE